MPFLATLQCGLARRGLTDDAVGRPCGGSHRILPDLVGHENSLLQVGESTPSSRSLPAGLSCAVYAQLAHCGEPAPLRHPAPSPEPLPTSVLPTTTSAPATRVLPRGERVPREACVRCSGATLREKAHFCTPERLYVDLYVLNTSFTCTVYRYFVQGL